MSMRTRRPARRALQAIAAAGTAAVAVGLLPAAAGAQETREAAPVAATEVTEAAKAKNFTYLSFKKNKKNPSNSRLSLVFVQQVNPDKVRTWTVDTWRAGSGLGTAKNKIGRNACVSNVGWLPNGTYKIKGYYNNFDGRIKGHVWQLQDMRCKNGGKKGTKRDALFIHSEMRRDGSRGTSEPQRWDGNSDYLSEGCIKLKPADIRELRDYRSVYPRPSKLYVS
ncbi:L,D-transpeptidase family protein [Streptomyces sp. CA-135486]|uniref:L,D-transpeptidase family protein n=1 Tax=Streptomyces sp. CA-135486 TaxID=3240049 RepID=UPI003D8BF123